MKKNPIVIKLEKIIEQGRTQEPRMSLELIAHLLDVSFFTVKNIFIRNRVSKTLLIGLRDIGVINRKDENEYYLWALKNVKPTKKRVRRKVSKKKLLTRSPKSILEDEDEFTTETKPGGEDQVDGGESETYIGPEGDSGWDEFFPSDGDISTPSTSSDEEDKGDS